MSARGAKDISGIEQYELPYYCELRPGDHVDEFLVEKKLGEGSFGIVFEVTDTNTSEKQALKLLKLWQIPHEEERKLMLRRFRREFECGQISSSHLVHSLSFGKVKGNPYITMEFCANGSLASYIGKYVDFKRFDRIAYEILIGLKDLHAEGKFHRDIKPENILFSGSNTVKLTDFGIAGFKNERMTIRNILGDAKEIFGTYAYIAPEQANRKISFKSMNAVTDIFSFGVSMYEVFTGKFPFGPLNSDSDLVNYLKRAKEGNWENINMYRSDIPNYWMEILNRSLHPDYKQTRFQSVDEIIPLLGHAPSTVSTISFNTYKDKIALQVMDGEERGRIYDLSSILEGRDGVVTIGWYDAELPNKNVVGIKETVTAYISNFHATIEKISNPETWFIRDGQWRKKNGEWGWYPSLNGVLVNSRDVSPEGALLSPNDIITIGDTTLKMIVVKG